MTLLSPAGTGTVDVTMVTREGTSAKSSADRFTYTVASPVITGLSPTSGPAAGGTLVAISGSNLAGATAVDFGSAQVTRFLSDTATQITLLSPAGSGTVDVTVVTPGGKSHLAGRPVQLCRHARSAGRDRGWALYGTCHGRHNRDDHRCQPGRCHGCRFRLGAGHALLISDTPTQIVVVSPAARAQWT